MSFKMIAIFNRLYSNNKLSKDPGFVTLGFWKNRQKAENF